MAFDITPYIDKKPSEVRKLIREGVSAPTFPSIASTAMASGMARS